MKIIESSKAKKITYDDKVEYPFSHLPPNQNCFTVEYKSILYHANIHRETHRDSGPEVGGALMSSAKR